MQNLIIGLVRKSLRTEREGGEKEGDINGPDHERDDNETLSNDD